MSEIFCEKRVISFREIIQYSIEHGLKNVFAEKNIKAGRCS